MAQKDIHFTFEITPANVSEDSSQSNASILSLDVIAFELEEGLNTPFLLEVELISHDADIDFDTILDQPALFTIYQKGLPVRYVHGLISDFQQGKTGFRRTRYKAVVEPSLARARISSDWKIFQQKTSEEILYETFKSNHIMGVEFNSLIEHTTREYVVQPGVLDFDFIQRLTAEEGYVYRIDSSANDHRLLLTDTIHTFGSIQNGENVLYNPNAGGDKPQPALHSFTYSQRVRTTQQTQRDYTFKNPKYNLQHEAHGADITNNASMYERYDYGTQAKYKKDAAGKPFTITKINALRNDAKIAVVIGDDAKIQPGLSFLLEGHQRQSFNTWWRPVKIIHRGTQHTASEEESATASISTSYEQTAELVLATDNWKADIPPPHKIEGSLIAHVTVPEGEEIYCDQYGRVKVIFPWQRTEQPNEYSSCWVRVAQNWAGAGWGHMAIPRGGQEVIVEFLGGDESQPIITGRTYDANHPTPYKLPALKTQQTTKSKEHKGEGYNELLIDDTTDELKTQLHTTHAATQLTMGHLTHPRNNDGVGEYRGDGFELRTDSWGAIRAGNGIYISADKQEKAKGKQLDLQEAITQLEIALDLAKELAGASQTAGAAQSDTQTQEYQLNKVYKELRQAGILASSPQGIALVTPKSVQISGGKNIALTAIESTDISTLKDCRVVAGDGVSILAVDKEMKLIANKGKLELQAQHNEMNINAKDDLEITSSQGKVMVAAKNELVLICGGAYIMLKDGQIELGGTKPLQVKMAGINLLGPSTMEHPLPSFSKGSIPSYRPSEECNIQFHFTNDNQAPYAHTKYTAYFEDGSSRQGVTDKNGYTEVFLSDRQEEVNVHLHINDAKKMTGDHNLRFHFFDDDGVPYANTTYTAYRANGVAEEGVTDEEGYTETFYADEPEEITVHLDI